MSLTKMGIIEVVGKEYMLTARVYEARTTIDKMIYEGYIKKEGKARATRYVIIK